MARTVSAFKATIEDKRALNYVTVAAYLIYRQRSFCIYENVVQEERTGFQSRMTFLGP